jgi:hypothetical protein|tara:strand:- start:816 stop:953 length:138 start_codon:yes stop_codon:yes gene_type:complete
MGANKRYFTSLRDYFSQKYSFVEEEMIWETLQAQEKKPKKTKKDE